MIGATLFGTFTWAATLAPGTPSPPTASQEAAPRFEAASERLGLALGNGPAAWVDVDGDGWLDLLSSDGLWRNVQGERFEKLAIPGEGLLADFDGDGDPDLFRYADQRLLENDGHGVFTERDRVPFEPVACRGAACGDLDGDGLLDLFVGGYEDWDAGITFPDHLLLRRGTNFEIAFTDARFRTRGVTACDFDEDGDLDLYLSHYRLQRNSLLRNDGHGGFEDVAESFGVLATAEGFAGGHSIGAVFADFDDDGHLDLFAGNFAHRDSRGDQPKSRFLRNFGPSHEFRFEDLGPCGVEYQESYASPVAGDFDQDGDVDLYFTTVYATASFGVANHAVLLRNDGQFRFTDATAENGLAALPPTYQAAFADFDRDGDLDLATAGLLFVNRTSDGPAAGDTPHWLEVELEDEKGRPAFGAQARIEIGARRLTRSLDSGVGEGNQAPSTLHFGLGAQHEAVSLEIRWPGAGTTSVEGVAVDQRLVIRRPATEH